MFAACMAAHETEVLSQRVEQRLARLNVGRPLLAIDIQRDDHWASASAQASETTRPASIAPTRLR